MNRLSDNQTVVNTGDVVYCRELSMPIVSITDYTFPSLVIEESLIRAAGGELRSGNDKQVEALKRLVADHTLAFILSATRQVVPNTLYVRDGKWGMATTLDQLRTLRDQVVGIAGFGRIGREVASRLAPFKCRRLVWTNYRHALIHGIDLPTDVQEKLRQASELTGVLRH